MAADPRVIVLTGLSGAGKTTALHALEDIGYFASDNVPPALWGALGERVAGHAGRRLAIGVDVRTRDLLGDLDAGFDALAAQGLRPTVVFLDAADETLLHRYNLTRRAHPLGEGSLSHDLEAERVALGALRARADLVLDTTDLSVKELIAALWRHFAEPRAFSLRLLSFGFKRGLPRDADLVLDARSLPNPFYLDALKGRPGTDVEVERYVFSPEGLELFAELDRTTRTFAEAARAAGRSSYTVAVGCTGGQHRSVAVTERLRRDLADRFDAVTEHRDLQTALEEHG